MRSSVLLVSLMFAACAGSQSQIAKLPPTPPRHPRIDGNTTAVSGADIRTVLALMRARGKEPARSPIPIFRIHVIDRNTMTIHYWIPDRDFFTYARRVKGHWLIDGADTERVKVTGDYIPA